MHATAQAAGYGNIPVVEFLLSHGAEVDAVNNIGKTALVGEGAEVLVFRPTQKNASTSYLSPPFSFFPSYLSPF